MYKNKLLKKTVVFGIILLFLGVSVVTAANINLDSTNVINDIIKPSRDTKIFYPTDDAKIAQDDPNKNYDGDSGINIRNEYGFGGSSGWCSDGLYRFDISSIPSGATILKATFHLFYNKWTSTNPVGRMLNVYRITSNWNEDTVTWNTAPTYNPAASAYSPVPATVNVWMEWDVTSDIQEFVSGTTNYGWRLRDDNYWGTFDIPLSQFRTREAGQELSPYLEVEYKKSKNYNVLTGLDDGPGWKFFLLGHITNIEIFEYDGIKFFNATALHIRGLAWNLFRNYPNIPLPINWIGNKFIIPYKLVKIIFPTLTGNYFLIAFGTMEI